MGYRYGEHRYSEGRYSRWPDWWHEKDCTVQGWQATACAPPAWLPADRRQTAWAPSPAASRAAPKPFRAAGT